MEGQYGAIDADRRDDAAVAARRVDCLNLRCGLCVHGHAYIHTYIHTCALLDFPKCLTAAEASPVAQKPVCGGNHTGLKV